ncbi:centromere protein Chl4/mis15/CENP-N [Thelonectria olida]|uniref:Centromere protein Chl4/mis15/CENP-N n=1 Tax=Thelonectria olida TaxID=1576542 RepID=A0A9P8W5Z3_9HYPO|nr:centromere protein Chl4/mis15/CENP-N [Thelonectria olida]
MARISVPTTSILPSTLRVEASSSVIQKSLNRLSRESLISLALDWLDDANIPNAIPYIQGEEDEDEDADDIFPPCQSLEELKQLYLDMQQQKGSKRDAISRIIEGDWRSGLTLYQLAMADFAYFDQNPTSQKWSSYQILPLLPPSRNQDDEEILKVDQKSLTIPRFHPSTFLQNLQSQVLPDVKAHYHFHRPKDFPVLLLRIFLIDSPYASNLALTARDGSGTAANFDSSRTVYIGFPDGSPTLYITKSQSTGSVGSGDSKSLQSLIVDGVPKALSRPRERYTLKNSNLTSRNLDAILEKKGSGRTNSAGGGWSIYTDERNHESPLDTVLPSPPLSREPSLTNEGRKRGTELTPMERTTKRARLMAKARFGDSSIVSDGKGVERVEIVVQDPFPSANTIPNEDDEDRHDEQSGPRSTNRRRSKIDAVIQEVDNSQAPEDAEEDARRADTWTPTVKISFQGTHAGIIDGERMPGWMTGEDGVTTGVVRSGRIRGHKGSGL